MKGSKKTKHGKTGATRRPYTAPRLTVHGDLRTLTRVKPGTKQDGQGKPATRDTGPGA